MPLYHRFSLKRTRSLLWRHNGRVSVSITSLTIVYSTVYSDADERKHQSSASLAFVRGIHRTKGQWRGKCFHLMTPSWYNSLRPSDAYVSQNYAIVSSDTGLSLVRRQVSIWTKVGLLLIGTWQKIRCRAVIWTSDLLFLYCHWE